ncbi:MAG: DUF58 domain-containing protein [Deltaproteobacteria bacterium]|nr:DUF58 domain-containing protein [Deltaproteobacteria bacterium]
MAKRDGKDQPLRAQLDWGELAPLHLRARMVADGLYAGAHRSVRRGAGVEFAGHRAYVPGDELRFIDVRASMRHERVVVRQFETETERALRLVVDATASMGFRGRGAPGAKLAFAAVLAAALARVALAGGDPVGLDWIGGEGVRRVAPSARAETFDRIVAHLESARAGGDARARPDVLEEGLGVALRGARRGSAIIVFSDLLDLPDEAAEVIAALGTRGRPLAVCEVLDPEEATLPYEGPIRLRAVEAGPADVVSIQTDAPTVRAEYLANLEARANTWRETLARHGGALVRSVTTDDPVAVVREILRAIARPSDATEGAP